MVILDKQKLEEIRTFNQKVMELALKRKIDFDKAKKILESNQSSLGDFRN